MLNQPSLLCVSVRRSTVPTSEKSLPLVDIISTCLYNVGWAPPCTLYVHCWVSLNLSRINRNRQHQLSTAQLCLFVLDFIIVKTNNTTQSPSSNLFLYSNMKTLCYAILWYPTTPFHSKLSFTSPSIQLPFVLFFIYHTHMFITLRRAD